MPRFVPMTMDRNRAQEHATKKCSDHDSAKRALPIAVAPSLKTIKEIPMHTSSASLGPLVQNQVSSDGTPAQRATDAILDDALNALEQYRGDPKAESRWKVVQCIEPLLKQKAQVTVGTLDLSECRSTDIKALPPAVVKALALRVGTLLMTGTPPDWVKELDKLADLTARHWRCCW